MDNQRFFTVAGSTRTYDRNKILTVVVSALALALLQVSSVNTLLTPIQTGLNASDAGIQWVLSGYALAFGIILIPVGRFGDIFGRSGAFVTGIAIFAFASLGCGLVSDEMWLNGMRIIQGFGAGVFSPQVTALIQQYFSGEDRARAFGIMGLVISASVAVGPITSGLFVRFLGDESGWRWSFIINLPLGLILLALAARWLPFAKERRTIGTHAEEAAAEHKKRLHDDGKEYVGKQGARLDLDIVGTVLVTIAVLMLMLPFMTHFTWRWFLLLGGFVLAGVWIGWEYLYKKHGHIPMVDLSLFRISSYSYCTAITTLQFLGMTSIFVVVAMFIQKGMGQEALIAGLIGLPNAILSAYGAVWAGKRSFTRGAQIQTYSLIIALVGVVLTIIFSYFVVYHNVSFWLLAVSLSLVGLGIGAVGPANQTQAMLHISPAHGGIAGGVQQTAQRIATAIGNALITAVFFAGRGADPHADVYQWHTGFVWALIVVSIAIVAAVIGAWIFMRKYPHAGTDTLTQQ